MLLFFYMSSPNHVFMDNSLRVFQAREGERKASEERETRATGEGATKQFNSVTIIWTNFNLKY